MDASDNSTPEPAAGTPAADAVAPKPAAPPVARSIGERLKAGRDRAGLSIAAAAEKLHLDPKVIEALEADRFTEVGASVYVRGHLRRYGDFVGENGTELVGMYGTRETRAAAPDLTQVPHPERRADPRRLVTPLVVLGSSAVLLAAIWWVLSGSRSMNPVTPAASTAPTTPPVADGAADAPAPVAQAPAVTATPVTLSNAPTPAASAAKPGSAATPAETAPVTRDAPAREIRLRLELTNDSWVEVYDSQRPAPVLRRGDRRQCAERQRAGSAARGTGECRGRGRRSRRAAARNSRRCRRRGTRAVRREPLGLAVAVPLIRTN